MSDVVLSLDLGASKFAAGLVDEAGQVLVARRVLVDHEADAAGLFGQVEGLVLSMLEESVGLGVDVVGCGVGAAGPISADRETVSPVNIEQWRDFPIRGALEQLAGVPVTLELDTKALAMGEAWLGDARGVANFCSMVVSTGVGGGIMLEGRLLQGDTGNAGHIGHIVVAPGGRTCGCGAQGCLEAEVSGRAIAALTGRPPAEANAQIVERTGRLVGRAVVSLANLLDLGLVFVAGSVALGFGTPFFEAAQTEIDANTRGGEGTRRIKPTGLGPQGALAGPAAVAWQTQRR